MRVVWLTAGIACVCYYSMIAVYAGPDADFAWFWTALGAVFFLLFFLSRYAASHSSLGVVILYRILVTVLAAGIAVMLLFALPVLRDMHLPDPGNADYIIVLGAQVKGRTPSRALKRRLDKAASMAETIPSAVLILSGGRGSGEDISEAECMRRYLLEQGIEEERLVLEDRSETTRENLIFSDRLTGCAGKTCGILSNDFHVYRALKIARQVGYTDVRGIDADGDAVMEVHYVTRESAALIVMELRSLTTKT